MTVTRRQFLSLAAGAFSLSVGTGIAAGRYTGRKLFHKPPRLQKEEGHMPADLHAHPARDAPLEEILELLSSGIVGLGHKNYPARRILSYEDAMDLFPNSITEIDKGRFARVDYNGKTGYIVRVQEILTPPEVPGHLVAVGIDGNYLPDTENVEGTARRIHEQGGVSILAHPYSVGTKKMPKCRLITKKEEERIIKLCEEVDQIEIFNGHATSIVPGFMEYFRLPFMLRIGRINRLAQRLAKECEVKGTASSDAHGILDHVLTSGIYVPEKDLDLGRLQGYIIEGNFYSIGQPLDLWSLGTVALS